MTTDLPLRHLSIRVPWHDTGWNGTVCADPVNNASCLRLHNIHERRDDSVEVELHGRRIDELEPSHQPPCVAERATFMADFPITRWAQHPYRTSPVHKHFRPTPVELPPYTAGAVPFRWVMMREASEFRGHDGSLRLPDFTIEDAATGETYIWPEFVTCLVFGRVRGGAAVWCFHYIGGSGRCGRVVR